MRVLLISYQFVPNLSVAADRTFAFAKGMSDEGHDVTVLTNNDQSHEKCKSMGCAFNVVHVPNPASLFLEKYFSLFSEEKAQKTVSQNHENRLGIFYNLIKKFNDFRIRRGILYLGRMPDVADFWYFRTIKWLRAQDNWDVVIASYAPYVTILLGDYLKKHRLTKKLICDFRDPWIEHHLFVGLPIFRSVEKYLFQSVTQRSDGIVTATESLSSLIALQSGRDVKTILNGASDTDVENIGLPFPPSHDDMVLVHTGSFYKHRQSLEAFFTSITRLDSEFRSNLRIIFCGNEKSYIDLEAKRFGITKYVYHLGFVSKGQCKYLVNIADMCLSFDLNSEEFSGVIPVKLFEYMNQSKPILFCYDYPKSDAMDLMSGYQLGYCCLNRANQIDETLSLMLEEMSLPSVFRPTGKSYTRENQMSELLSMISNG